MKVTVTGLIILFFSSHVHAVEAWETCLDQGDFLFNANSFTRSQRMSKSECMMRLVEIGGQGKKFEINLCDAQIHIDEFGALESKTYTRHYAGSAACPAPLFGADFDLPKEQKGGREFQDAKRKVLEIQAAVKLVIAPEASAADAEKVKGKSSLNSSEKIACAQRLLHDYLDKCIAFQPKPKEEAKIETKSTIPGVHNSTIQTPAKP